MRIAVDVDGVLADQRFVIAELVRQETGIEFSADDVVEWNQPIGDTCIGVLIRHALRTNPGRYALSMPVMPGAREAMCALGCYHALIVVTSRPLEAARDTLAWLQNHKIPLDAFCCRVPKHELGADILVDDYHYNVNRFAATNKPAILFRHPWNASEEIAANVSYAQDWHEVVEIIRKLDHATRPDDPDPRLATPPEEKPPLIVRWFENLLRSQ